MSCSTIDRLPFAQGLASGKIVFCEKEVDDAYIKNVAAQAWPGPRNV